MNDYISVSSIADPYPRFDMMLISVVGCLLALGAIMVFSASVGVQGSSGGESLTYLDVFWRIGKHLASIFVGLSVLAAASFINIEMWRRVSGILFLLGILLLAILLVPGVGLKINGSTRWLNIGSFGIQPSEFVKVLVIYI